MRALDFDNLLPSPDECRRIARLNRLTLRGSSPEAEFAARWSTEGGDYCVYCLADAGKRIRYIGITNQRVEVRLAQHLADCGRGKNVYKENWLRSCAKRNVEVTIHVVRSGLSAKQAGMIEEMLIKLLKKPFGLTNTHAGGATGYAGLSDESREKHRINTKKGWARLIERELGALDTDQNNRGVEESGSAEEQAEHAGLKLISASRPMMQPRPEMAHPTLSASGEGRAPWEDALIRTMRGMHLSWRTERAYHGWALRFASFVAPRLPTAADGGDVAAFLSSIAVNESVSQASQRQALSAVMFLMQDALLCDLGEIEFYEAATRLKRHDEHTILTKDECCRLLTATAGMSQLMATLMYSAGLRLHELLELRVGYLDIEQRFLRIPRSKGGKSRAAVFSEKLRPILRTHLERLHSLWQADQNRHIAGVWVPDRVAARRPNAGVAWGWQWMFPSRETYVEPTTGIRRRHHVSGAAFQGALKSGGKKSGLKVAVSSQVLRLSFAFHMIEAGLDMRTLKDLLGRSAVQSANGFTRDSAESDSARPSGEQEERPVTKRTPKRELPPQPEVDFPF